MGKGRKLLIVALTTVALLAMLLLDLNLPSGVIHGIPYVVLISVSYWYPWRRAPQFHVANLDVLEPALRVGTVLQ